MQHNIVAESRPSAEQSLPERIYTDREDSFD